MKAVFSPRAEKQFQKLAKINQIIIAKKLRALRDGPKIPNERKLKDYKNIFKIRIGDYRIIYKKRKDQIHIILLGHRKEVYRLLDQILK